MAALQPDPCALLPFSAGQLTPMQAIEARHAVRSYTDEPLAPEAVEALREAEDGDSWTLTIDRDVVRSRGPGTDAQTSLAETSYGEVLVPLMSEYGLREVTVACDAGEHLAVTFGAVRYDNEDFTKDGVFLIWIDPGYHGRDSGQPDRTLDAGYADEILRWWPAEEERIREHWYFWSVSGEPTC